MAAPCDILSFTIYTRSARVSAGRALLHAAAAAPARALLRGHEAALAGVALREGVQAAPAAAVLARLVRGP
jgi:hypothetical protein